MSNFADYKREETPKKIITGNRRCVIVAAEESISKSSGLPMIVVTVTPSESKAKVKTYIVKNEKFNANMTRFFDAFPTIEEGNFDFVTWVGAIGAANFGTDENGYLKVKWFIDPIEAKLLPEWFGDKPEQQTVTAIGESVDDDDMPF